MDAVAYSLASKQAQRIEKFINDPDSTSGIVTVPKVIASGENITIPAGRVAVLPNVQVDGVLNIEGDVFVPSGATFGDIENQIALKAPLLSPDFTGNPTAPTQTAGDNSTKVATTAYVDGKMVLGTAVNSTSGTAIDFTGIPSWVKRITVMFKEASTNGGSSILVQIGDAGVVKTSDYVSSSSLLIHASSIRASSSTSGFLILSADASVPDELLSGMLILSKIDSTTWVASGISKIATNATVDYGGSKTLSGTLDRIRITTANGTDTFDAGQINIMYEG